MDRPANTIPKSRRPLRGKLYCCFWFVDDPKSSWTAAECDQIRKAAIAPALKRLKQQAARYNLPLTVDYGFYNAQTAAGFTLNYPDCVTGPFVREIDHGLPRFCALQAGCSSIGQLSAYLRSSQCADAVVQIFLLNKPGRSRAITSDRGSSIKDWEHLLVFAHYEDGQPLYAASLLHELLHQFGAEDLYDPFERDKARYELAQKLCPDDVMLRIHPEIDQLNIDALTAWLIGWIDIPPVKFYPLHPLLKDAD